MFLCVSLLCFCVFVACTSMLTEGFAGITLLDLEATDIEETDAMRIDRETGMFNWCFIVFAI